MRDHEEIDFEIWLGATFWDKNPKIEIFLNNDKLFDFELVKQGITKVKFKKSLQFNNIYKLSIARNGKSNDQTLVDFETGETIDQIAWLEKLIIDSIDVRHIVWSDSVYYPEFPEPWASEQRNNGIELEYPVLAGTHWGHNGIWELEFSSPFYKFLINKMQ